MPTFEHTVTIISLLVGFAGVPLGWWLSELTRSRAASQATTELETRQMREGVVGLIEAARDMSEGARAYGYANYLKATGQPVGGQLKEIAAELNTARTLLDRRYINTRILGPEWIRGAQRVCLLRLSN